MTLYEYRCNACGDVVEMFRRMSDRAYSFCIKCENGVLEKTLTAPHLHGSPNMPNA